MSCGGDAERAADARQAKQDTTFEGYKIIIIDGCEYIYKRYDNFSGIPVLTHKGNCKNPIHNKCNCNTK